MNELYSNIKDCNILARKLKEQLGNKIEFYNHLFPYYLIPIYLKKRNSKL